MLQFRALQTRGRKKSRRIESGKRSPPEISDSAKSRNEWQLAPLGPYYEIKNLSMLCRASLQGTFQCLARGRITHTCNVSSEVHNMIALIIT